MQLRLATSLDCCPLAGAKEKDKNLQDFFPQVYQNFYVMYFKSAFCSSSALLLLLTLNRNNSCFLESIMGSFFLIQSQQKGENSFYSPSR